MRPVPSATIVCKEQAEVMLRLTHSFMAAPLSELDGFGNDLRQATSTSETPFLPIGFNVIQSAQFFFQTTSDSRFKELNPGQSLYSFGRFISFGIIHMIESHVDL
jgi:hypothetical protein